MRKPSSRRQVCPEHPLTWDDVAKMYGAPLAEAIRDLNPVTNDEVQALIASFHMLAAGGTEMIPASLQQRQQMRRVPILDAGSRACLSISDAEGDRPGHLVMRDAVNMVLELCLRSGDAEPINGCEGWLWGPMGPPLRHDLSVNGISQQERFEMHAQRLGGTWDASTRKAFETASEQRFKSIVESGSDALTGMSPATDNMVAAACLMSQYRQSLAAVATLASLGDTAGDALKADLSDKAWLASDAIHGAAIQAMAAAQFMYVKAVADTEDLEERAMEMIRRVAWTEAVVDRWDAKSPEPQPPRGSYWELEEPHPDQYWTAAFLAGRCQIGYAANGLCGTAAMLMNRA